MGALQESGRCTWWHGCHRELDLAPPGPETAYTDAKVGLTTRLKGMGYALSLKECPLELNTHPLHTTVQVL
jgi:hypothetical protein